MNAPRTSTTGLCVDTEESDSILGTKTVGDGIHAELEPVNRFIITQKTNTLTAECQITAQHSIFSALPPHARRSVPLSVRPTSCGGPASSRATVCDDGTTGLKIYRHHEARVQ
ncbi:MAG: hypothetical protein B5766_09195 [Candidatus Lumbricidophila eiseniae]|uniref:Uncharacterized protein n=1 Tax=Candidatus Lumbricidiphila eiseniae TaxID=1969409 RepID=A0A2A6FR82_9MICO|nr:MAG: hypothetical protein B5766_09195 [Candidatus Lumbricidophila eiseniae]